MKSIIYYAFLVILLLYAASLFVTGHAPAMMIILIACTLVWAFGFLANQFKWMEGIQVFGAVQLVGWSIVAILLTKYSYESIVYYALPLGVFLGVYIVLFVAALIAKMFTESKTAK